MAKRIKDLSEIAGALTDYTFEVDNELNAETEKVTYEDLELSIVTAAAPVISTPTITESNAVSVTTLVSKKAVNGRLVTLNLKFLLTATTDAYLDILLDTPIAGTTSQVLSAYHVPFLGTDVFICNCFVQDDDPFTIRIYPYTGTFDGQIVFNINGTLITS